MSRYIPLSTRYDRALVMAADLHREQVNKGTTIPNLAHLLAVSAIVLEHGGSETQAIAALLHDGPEDQGGEPALARVRMEFGHRALVECVPSASNWLTP